MKYNNIYIENVATCLPPHVISSEEIEKALAPVYEKLNLSPGRLELFTGIKERRAWPAGTKPSEVSSKAGKIVMEETGVLPEEIDCLIHSSVCRDFLEPATASVVHSNLKLRPGAVNFDISNACLGMMTGITLLADMIEAGRIKRGLVVSGEIGFPLLKSTVKTLVEQEKLTRKELKPHFASLTIGSASSAILVCHESVKKTRGHQLLGYTDHSATEFNYLCQGNSDRGMSDESAPQMHTDSEELLKKGIEAAKVCWKNFTEEMNWNEEDIDKTCSHQVGTAHRNLLYKSLGIDINKDFTTFDKLGNCGSSSLPLTMAMAEEEGHLKEGDNVSLLAIGSGINVCLLAVKW